MNIPMRIEEIGKRAGIDAAAIVMKGESGILRINPGSNRITIPIFHGLTNEGAHFWRQHVQVLGKYVQGGARRVGPFGFWIGTLGFVGEVIKVKQAAQGKAIANAPGARYLAFGINMFVVSNAGIMIDLLIYLFGQEIIIDNPVGGRENFVRLV